LHKDCPEKGNTASTQTCCNCQLAEGEKSHLAANYRGCKHAKEEMRKKKPQGTPKPTSGRVLSSNPVSSHLSFAAALRGQGNQQLQEEAPANISNPEATTTKTNVQKTGQSVQAPLVNSETLDMVRALTVVEQIMSDLKGAAFDEAKFFAHSKKCIQIN
jgi:hypothetical protein